MNSRQLKKLGVPASCVKAAMATVQHVVSAGLLSNKQIKGRIEAVVSDPESFLNDDDFSDLAEAIIEDRQFVPPEPIPYQTWGEDGIDEMSHRQMRDACQLPCAVGAALMPDAHIGYGLPIGGVLACENAVIPYAVGVDIACRMKMSVLDIC